MGIFSRDKKIQHLEASRDEIKRAVTGQSIREYYLNDDNNNASTTSTTKKDAFFNKEFFRKVAGSVAGVLVVAGIFSFFGLDKGIEISLLSLSAGTVLALFAISS